MVTTVFNKPQTMELNMPPNDNPVEVPMSKLLTLRVMPNMNIYWNMGTEPLNKIEMKDLRKFLIEKRRGINDLITLVKIDRDAKYNDMVDVVDELNLAEITKFSFDPMKESDKKLIAKLGG
jgi:biopolymer transport protein ExbD